jgi:hypothetical protein
LDNNNVVNSRDLNTLLSNYNQSGVDLDGDIDSNGIVNSKDLNALLSNYNQTA